METKYRIHAFYILLIFLTIIVLLVSVKWSEIPTLAQYVTFALTLSSLLLAILAIIYSFYSNSSVSQNISTLSGLSHQVAQSADRIRVSTDEIVDQIRSLPSHLENVEGKVEETQSLLKEYFAKQPVEQPSTKPSDPSLVSRKLADHFLSVSSDSGLFLMHACYLASASQNKKLDLRALCEQTKVTDASYAYGFCVAAIATGILTATGTEQTLSIVAMDDNIARKAKDTILTRIEEYPVGQKKRMIATFPTLEVFIANRTP